MRTLAIALAAVLLAAPVQAGTGDLDPAFGAGGVVAHTVFPGPGGAFASAVLVQPDGRIVAVGTNNGPINGNGFALARHLPDGTLDPAFGAGGTIVETFAADMGNAPAALLQPDGKIVAANCVVNFGPPTGATIVGRWDATGAPDPGFGTGGFASVLGIQACAAAALALQADGKMLLAGSGTISCTQDVVLARLLADGTPDPGFGTGGILSDDIEPSCPLFGASAATVQPDQKILVAADQRLVRYDPAGARDAAFGAGGVAPGACTGCRIGQLALLPDGRIVALLSVDGASDFAVARFHADGTLDASFGVAGVARVDADVHIVDVESGLGMLVDPDGRIVVVGVSGRNSFEDTDMAVVRLLPDGGLDHAFGAGGWVLTHFGARDFALGVARQPDGKLVVAGAADAFAQPNGFAVARYEGECPVLPDADGDGVGDACDPCTNGAALAPANVRIASLLAPPGEQRLKVKAAIPLPLLPDPAVDGIRVLLRDADGELLADVPVPGTADDAVSSATWTVNALGTGFRFRPKSQVVAVRGHIVRGAVALPPAGMVKVTLTVRNADLADAPARLPLSLTVVLDARRSEVGACGEVAFTGPPPAPACIVSNTGSAVRCR